MKYLEAVIDGVEMDLEPVAYYTFAELRKYCYHVASVVGLSCIHIWGFRGSEATRFAGSSKNRAVSRLMIVRRKSSLPPVTKQMISVSCLCRSPTPLEQKMTASASEEAPRPRPVSCHSARRRSASCFNYCLTVHSYTAEHMAKLPADEIILARKGHASDPKRDAALQFARKVIETRGKVSDADLKAVRDAGYTDANVMEIVALVAMYTLTNFFNNVFDPEKDFPAVTPAGSI